MRIFGADGFVGKDTSINAIPVNYIRNNDICLVRVGSEDPLYIPAIYFYEYFTNDGNDESIPHVIVPLDNLDTNFNTNESGDDGGRWKLKSIYTNRLIVDELVTNTITAAVSGQPIYIGDDLTVGDHGIIVDGQVDINSADTEPPLIVNSSVMVENLNAEYLGGEQWDNFLRNDNHQIQIPNGVSELDVYMTHAMVDPPHYSVMIDICNIIDTDPSIYSFIITNKTETYFTVKFSGIIDTPNYTLHYFLIGSTDSSIDPPPPSGSPPSGSPG